MADTLLQRILDQTNVDTLVYHVDALSGEDSVTILDGRYLIRSRDASHPDNELAGEYLFQRLVDFGLPAYSQQFSATGRNVYGVKTGVTYPEKRVIVCAHYDSRPYEPGPGADDNASGAAVVLEAARILSSVPTAYSVVFALWDEEEIGLRGSAYYASRAYQTGESVVAVVNLDMLGWDGNSDGLVEVHTRPVGESEQLANLVLQIQSEYSLGLMPTVHNPGTTASDHSSFWNYGYSAVLLIEGYRSGDFNPYYHSSLDRREHFNLEYFHASARLALATVAHLSLYESLSPTGDGVGDLPASFSLEQNFPNPFNLGTTIQYALPKESNVRLAVYNLLGQEVALLVDGVQAAGIKSVDFNASGLPTGVYHYRLTAGQFVETKKLLLLK